MEICRVNSLSETREIILMEGWNHIKGDISEDNVITLSLRKE
jgi:hypothetical protein